MKLSCYTILTVALTLSAHASYEDEPLFRQAIAAAQEHRYVEADGLFMRLGQNPAYTARSLRSRGTLAISQGKVEESDDLYFRAYKAGDITALWNLVGTFSARQDAGRLKSILTDLERNAPVNDDALAGYLVALGYLDNRDKFLTCVRNVDEKRILGISKGNTDLVLKFLQLWAEERDKPLLEKLNRLKITGELYHN